MFRMNPLLSTDGYKPSHYPQFPDKTTNTHYYGESRGGSYGKTVWFGLQGYARDNLFRDITSLDIEEAKVFYEKYGVPFNAEGWTKLVGRPLPIRIKALKEGSVVPTHNALITVESTDPEFYWLPSWLETSILRGVWYPTTVATRSYYCKRVIHQYLHETSNAPMAELPFKLHDFGGRGVSSGESAAVGGAAHLVNFKGSDTVEGIAWMSHHYGVGEDGIPAFSIPAMEHSTVLAWGRNNEVGAFRNMLEKFAKPGKILACVSDTYDYYNAVTNLWCGELRDEVKSSGATVVIRPDSGHPPEVVLKTLQIMDKKLGCEKNMLGYKVLPSYFRVIQGDGNNNEDDIEAILSELKTHGYSASNVAFGMGGGLLQKLDRDTQKFAFKKSEITVDGEVRQTSKDPKTDPGKKSKAGRFSVIKDSNGDYKTISGENLPGDCLETVYENGKLVRMQNLDEIRKLAGAEFR